MYRIADEIQKLHDLAVDKVITDAEYRRRKKEIIYRKNDKKGMRGQESPKVSGGGMNVISTIIGLLLIIVALFAFIPFFGSLNWLVMPAAIVGLVLGLFSTQTTGRNINLVVLLIAMFRLFVGGGVL